MVWVRWNDSSKTTKDWGGDVKSSKVGRTKEPGSRGEIWAWGAPEANLKSDLFMAVGGKINSAWACTSDRHTYFLLIIGSEAGAHHSCVVLAPPPPPPPSRLSVITVSLRSRHPPVGLNLLINLVLIVCTKAPIKSWFVYILTH